MATEAEKRDFIVTIAPIIKRVASERGYLTCAAVIAQACIEGGWGKSALAAKYNNHFGMKCGAYWKGPSVNFKTKEEYTPGTLTEIRDNFRVYSSMEEGVRGYYDFINTKRYARLKVARGYAEYAKLLKECGYATSSQYVTTLVSTVMKYNLERYDGIMPTLRLGAKGDCVKQLQSLLNTKKVAGGNIKVDGLFGPVTHNAVVEFQALNGLTKDGIVGMKTWGKLYE